MLSSVGSNHSLLLSLDEPNHPLLPLVTHYSGALLSSALAATEKHSTQIELIRRRLAAGPSPSPNTRRVNFLKGIAKATEAASSDNKTDLDDSSYRGWDTDTVEDMWNAVFTYIQEMGSLFNDLAVLRDAVDRSIDKSNVPPQPAD